MHNGNWNEKMAEPARIGGYSLSYLHSQSEGGGYLTTVRSSYDILVLRRQEETARGVSDLGYCLFWNSLRKY